MKMAGLRWAVNMANWRTIVDDWSMAMSCVQTEEKSRINQFVFAEDASLSLIGRLLLRAAAVKMMGVPNDVIAFGRTEKWKPYLIDGCGLELNVSHQGNYAVLAAEWNKKVGVDIMESTRPRGVASLNEFFTTMNRQFTKKEWCQIKSPPTEKDQLSLFYRFWCLKESYIKALGTGLSHGLQRLEFTLDPSSSWHYQMDGICCTTRLAVDGILTDKWLFEESFLDEKHCVAVAIEGDCLYHESFTEVSVPELLSGLVSLSPVDRSQWLQQKERPSKIKNE